MTPSNLPKSVAIIGAGAAGLFTARRLRQLGVADITLLEKEASVGGKCNTYCDTNFPDFKAERGAVFVVPNYGVVLDAIIEKNVKTQRNLATRLDTVEFINKIKGISYFESTKFITGLCYELLKFTHAVWSYKRALNKMQPLPKDLELPFAVYAKKNGLESINLLLKPIVSGFGYGAMEDCPTYSILEYMGYTTIPCLMAQYNGFRHFELMHLHDGFQHLMRKIATDFSVMTSANISHVKRQGQIVDIEYLNNNGQRKKITVDALVLAISPLHWENVLGRDSLTTVERECLANLTYYRYPVVICHLKGLMPNYIYNTKALEKNNFGHVAYVTTSDDRPYPEEGRLCTAYINLPPGNNNFSLSIGGQSRETILDDLRQLPGVTEAAIVEVKTWEDYFSSLPWQMRLKLEKEQFAPATKTMYVGSYTLGSFEDVACVANSATQAIDRCFNIPQPSYPAACVKEIQRFFQFFKCADKMNG